MTAICKPFARPLTIYRGVVRSALALDRHRNGIYNRSLRAASALRAAESRGIMVCGERTEAHASAARADEASKMHLVAFVPPYVPAKASRVYPALQTCTSPRRAARVVARANNRFINAMNTYTSETVQALRSLSSATPRKEMSVGYASR